MEETIEQLKFKLRESEENYQNVVDTLNKANLECAQIKMQLNEAKSINDRLIRIIENLSRRD